MELIAQLVRGRIKPVVCDIHSFDGDEMKVMDVTENVNYTAYTQ